MIRGASPLRVLFLALALAGAVARAQTTVTAVTTTTSTTAASTTEGGTNPTTLTFLNDVRAVSTYVAGGVEYLAVDAANNVFVRRNTGAGNANRTSLWMENDAAANTVNGTDRDSLPAVFLDNNLFQGADNVFVNGTSASQSNIERVDFVWSGGFTVAATTDGLAVFERGAAGAHDAFQVAVITSLGSGLASPLTWTFGSVLEIASTNYGANLDVTNDSTVDTLAYRLLRYNAGDTLTTHNPGNETGSQGLAGVHISFADLGISVGTTIYGYAIMASDVTNVSANLVNWNTATFYPTNTADTSGGIDFAAFGGQRTRVVPEPSVYGAGLLGLGAALLAWRRRRAARVTSRAA
jgi:hypothetical protein